VVEEGWWKKGGGKKVVEEERRRGCGGFVSLVLEVVDQRRIELLTSALRMRIRPMNEG